MQDFLELLAALREGRAIEDARRAIAEVEEAVVEHGKPGSVTLTLTLKPASKGNRLMVSVIDQVTIKKPVGEKEETLLFRAGDGRFTRRDPRQPELPIRVAQRDSEEMKEASNA